MESFDYYNRPLFLVFQVINLNQIVPDRIFWGFGHNFNWLFGYRMDEFNFSGM